MTQYVVWAQNPLGLKAATYPIKIAAIFIYNSDDGGRGVNFFLHTGATLSGTTPSGDNGVIFPMRSGTPAASAVTRIGSLTFSGTEGQLARRFLGGSTFDFQHQKNVTFDSFSTQTDLVIAPGEVLEIAGLGFFAGAGGGDHDGTVETAVYFEELR
jgi:hypothetical protein